MEELKTKKICACCGAEVEDWEEVEIDGEIYCSDCAEPCEYCGEYHLREDLTEVSDGRLICESCLEEYFFYCERCGDYEEADNCCCVNVSGGYTECWCSYCVENHAFKCYHCEEYFSRDDYEEVEDYETSNIYCYEHACDYLYYCDGCNNWTSSPTEEYDGVCLCEYCAEQRGFDVLKHYHAHKDCFTPIYTGCEKNNIKKHLVGFELEVDGGASCDLIDCVKTIDFKYNKSDNFLFFEKDGSLSSGFEIISQPLSIDYIRSFDFQSLKDICNKFNFKSHYTDTCGLHLHFNREMFGSNEQAQNRTIAKIITFYNIFYGEMVKLSRRKNGELHWAERYYNNNGEALKVDTKELKKKYGRYYAVNNSNTETVEFRLGKGSLNPDTIRAWVELHYRLILNAKKIKWSDINNIKAWLQDMPEIVVEYMKKREAFGYSEAGDNLY